MSTHLFPCSTEQKNINKWFWLGLIPPSDFEIPLWLCLQLGVSPWRSFCWLWSSSVQPAHLWRGWIEAGVGELQSSRLTGATNKIEAMLDQQPKTNQVKQQPCSSSGCWEKGWQERKPRRSQRQSVFYCHTHTRYILLVYPGVFSFTGISLTLKPEQQLS